MLFRSILGTVRRAPSSNPLIEILLPVSDKEGRPFTAGLYQSLRDELTERYRGVTAFTRAPAEGETKAGRKADVKNLTDATYQASFTDEQMFKQIKEGLKDKNGKEKMKAFADKVSDEEIKALVAFVRGLKK